MTELKNLQPNVAPTKHPKRFGVSLTMGIGTQTLISPEWCMGPWRLQFVTLPSGEMLALDPTRGALHVKVILGALETPKRRAYPVVGSVVTTRMATNLITAGADGALVAIFTAGADVEQPLASMSQLQITGPLAEHLEWQSFEQRFGSFTPFFNGADAHLVSGFHLLDTDGAEIAYVYFWTAGKGVDLSTHNHGNTPSEVSPAFAEVHQVLNNGTGKGGMYRTAEPGAPTRTRLPMQRGDEHGPFFMIEVSTGLARLRENGAVEYPWHGWEAGNDDLPGQRYDLVAAYEITAPYSKV
jgi:Aldos-2-ulose dehydratase/isomerase (AUDH) Cupin domain